MGCMSPSSLCGDTYGSHHFTDQRWNYEFIKLLSQVMATAFTSRPPPYAAILDLDRKLRDFDVPPYLRLQWTGQESSDSLLWVKRWVVLSNKEWGKHSLTLSGYAVLDVPSSTLEYPSRIFRTSAT
jgi:hypothetical protein